MAGIESKLIDTIEDALRETFGDIVTERMVNDQTGEVFVSVYRTEPNFSRTLMLTKDLVDDFNNGSLRA
jgi:hypothetical protein